MKFKELATLIDGGECLSIKYPGKVRPPKLNWWDTDSEEDLIKLEDLITLEDALEQFSDWEVDNIEPETFIYSVSCSKLVVYLKEEI